MTDIDLRGSAEAVKDIDWTIVDVMLRTIGTVEQIASVKQFLMDFNPEVCLKLIGLLDSAARILYDTAEAQHFNVDDARLVLRQMDEQVGLLELA